MVGSTQAFPMYGTSRIVAGGPVEGGIFKCALKPVDAALTDGTYAHCAYSRHMPFSQPTTPARTHPSPPRTARLSSRIRFAPLAAALLLAACASAPPPASKAKSTSAPSASSASDPRADRASPSPSGKKSRSAKAAPDSPAAPRREAPAAVAKADRNFSKPARGAVLARFDGRGNKGIDFAGASGDPVYAARAGTVVYSAADLRGYGRMIIIKHDATYLTAYAHNSELLVKNGQAVKRGQQIARMGSSDTNRVKLHFELRKNGSAVDPAPYFATGEGADAAGSPG